MNFVAAAVPNEGGGEEGQTKRGAWPWFRALLPDATTQCACSSGRNYEKPCLDHPDYFGSCHAHTPQNRHVRKIV